MTSPAPVADHVTYTRAMWKVAVARGLTSEGYQEWVNDCLSRTPSDTFHRISERELHTIIAALRHWQRYGAAAGHAFTDIANNNGTVVPPSNDQLDDLVERMNLQPVRPVEGYLIVHHSGKVATIVRHKPGPRCKLLVKELVAK